MDLIGGMGGRIKEQRLKHNMSQKQLAKKLSLKQSTISNYEREQALPSTEILYQMACIFDCTTDYLCGLDNRRYIAVNSLTNRQEDLLRQFIDTIEPK